ncbi:26S proteasome non-ATPase regulatory protein [Pyrenophora tritici-repentis]|nr:26S proteasome non-ATPase regulatory protein [Pyrenophora tritici-repentis]
MSSGEVLKAGQGLYQGVDVAIPEAEKLASSNPQAGIDKLLTLEKQTRQASDLASTSRVIIAIVTIAKNAKDWNLMNEQVLLLSKKHGQLKQATTKMTLRTVTEGKIFVEVERARVTRILSNIKKEQGDIDSATDILCELQVETFGSMTRREKTEFILQQVALCIQKGDWNRPYSEQEDQHTEKTRSVDDPPIEPEDDVTDLKLKYYEQQITLAKHDNKYLDVCKHYRQVLDTEAVEEDPDKLRAILQRVIYFIILAPYDNEQSDLIHRIQRDSRNSQIPQDAQLVKLFTDDSDDPKAFQRWQDLRKRVIEHNVRVVAKYYTRIQIPRLTELLDLTEDETEKNISELVSAKTIYARSTDPRAFGNMKSLLGLLERVDHLITKEEMMARIQPTKVERARRPRWVNAYTGIGAGIDSFFEYALKSHILLSGLPFDPANAATDSPDAFLAAWLDAHDGIKRQIYRGKQHTSTLTMPRLIFIRALFELSG